ncbi:MAG: GNAT family N-acetyltransferase [Planctomycetes bacterium]|nr:GNAT family N-acetyltransferase [Planctomycetota bacterium]
MRPGSRYRPASESPRQHETLQAGGATFRLRPFQSEDATAVIRLIDSVYQEYGDRICLENADRDLLEIDRAYVQAGGSFFVLADDQELFGCHAVLPWMQRPNGCTFRRLYLHSSRRGQGWGRILMRRAIDWALAAGYEQVEFWSDTRFTTAHKFFEKIGFQRQEAIRPMDDGWVRYHEYLFRGELGTLHVAGDRAVGTDGTARSRQRPG